MKREKQNPLVTYKVSKAVELLKAEMQSIPDVQTWDSEAGVSRRWLYQVSKQVHDCTPGEILREARYEAIKQCLRDDSELIGYNIALAVGLRDEKALYKFLSIWYDTSLRQLRIKILKEKPDS